MAPEKSPISSTERSVNRQACIFIAVSASIFCVLVLVLGGLVWSALPTLNSANTPQVFELPTLRPVGATTVIGPSSTPGAEVNVALNKPVQVSASWVVDPPERAVNGNTQDWWGAGGPSPQWIEVDLEGFYSVSKIKVISEGPTGPAVYRILGRGLENKYQLLYTFDGNKSENQTLEFLPETAWTDISAIRIEITGGSGWVSLREVQVYSREEPKSLPASSAALTPSFLAQVQSSALEQITPENANQMQQLAMLGRGTINDLAWSPDGKTLAAAGAVGIWLYDPSALESSPRLLEGHTREVLSVEFNADGTTVFSGSQDGTVKQWDVATGDLKRTISLWNDFSYEVGEQKRNPEVWSIAFSPDQKLLAAGGFDGTVRIWNLSTATGYSFSEGHTRQVSSLTFSPDGKLLASSGQDGSVFLWDVATRKKVAALSGHRGWVRTLVFSPDGKSLATGSEDTTIRLWDAEKGTELLILEGHPSEVLSLAFSPDGQTVVSNGWDGLLRFWDVETGESLPIQGELFGATQMVFSPDGASLATSTEYGMVQLLDTATGSQSAFLITHTSPVTSITFSPDNRLLATGAEDGLVRVWDIEANELLGFLAGHSSGVTGVVFSPDGKLLASSSFDGTVRLWDMLTGKQVAMLGGKSSYLRSVAFSPDGKMVAAGGTDKTVSLWDTSTGIERAVLTGHTAEVQSVAFSPHGAWILSASADNTLRVWEVATGTEMGVLRGHTSYVQSAGFSPNSMIVASGAGDHLLRVWDLELASDLVTGRNRFTPVGHGGWVLSVAFSPDGEIVASANVSTTSYWVAPGEVHLYSAETGSPYALLRGHTKRVTSIAFSPDGKLLASGSADGSVRLWGVP